MNSLDLDLFLSLSLAWQSGSGVVERSPFHSVPQALSAQKEPRRFPLRSDFEYRQNISFSECVCSDATTSEGLGH